MHRREAPRIPPPARIKQNRLQAVAEIRHAHYRVDTSCDRKGEGNACKEEHLLFEQGASSPRIPIEEGNPVDEVGHFAESEDLVDELVWWCCWNGCGGGSYHGCQRTRHTLMLDGEDCQGQQNEQKRDQGHGQGEFRDFVMHADETVYDDEGNEEVDLQLDQNEKNLCPRKSM